MSICSSEQGLFLSVYVDDINRAGRRHNMAPTWKTLMKLVDLGKPTSFLDHENLGCTQRECEPNEDAVNQNREIFESRITAAATEQFISRVGENLTQKRSRGPTTWKDTRENALKDIASWRTKRHSNCTTFQLFAWTAIISRRKNWKRLENSNVCSQIVVKCLYLARIGRPDILWSVNNFAGAVTKWTRACDKRLFV